MKKKMMILALSAGLSVVAQASDDENWQVDASKNLILEDPYHITTPDINKPQTFSFNINNQVEESNLRVQDFNFFPNDDFDITQIFIKTPEIHINEEKELISTIQNVASELVTSNKKKDKNIIQKNPSKTKEKKKQIFQYKIDKKVSVSYTTEAGKKALDLYKKYSEETIGYWERMMSNGLYDIHYSTEIEGYETEDKAFLPKEICEDLLEEFGEEGRKLWVSLMFLNNYPDILEKFLEHEEDGEVLKFFENGVKFVRDTLKNYRY